MKKLDKSLIINSILSNVHYGILAMQSGTGVYQVPLNYAWFDDKLFFHGSKKGTKMALLRANNQASFSVVDNYSFIPSYFSAEKGMACPASQFYQSVLFTGYIDFVDDYKYKALILNKLMQKMQSEGRYLDLNDSVYKTAIDVTQILQFIPESISLKVKMGQQHSQEKYDRILAHLEQRNEDLDRKTIALMQRYRGLKL